MEIAEKSLRQRSNRPMRNRRYSQRRFLGEERRPIKRLFTPEIKRFLKDWLVRRRDNPYPNRDEKKSLAVQTGLTYIQICNWFANWRRKLKNSGGEPQRRTWGHLIKSYNTQANGNLEQFSISSNDSIWAEPDQEMVTYDEPYGYKRRMMRRYLDDLDQLEDAQEEENTPLLTRWLESAANFRPRQRDCGAWGMVHPGDSLNTKYKPPSATNVRDNEPARANGSKCTTADIAPTQDRRFVLSSHRAQEIEAAEALTRLAGLYRRGV